jgi:DNA-binding CsgD family transcriptional regulator
LKALADFEGRTTDDVLNDVLAKGIVRYQTFERLWDTWESLSSREKEITALICLEYTNRQISARLSLSPETIKTHVHNVLLKFGVKSKSELRHILASWDFSAWI